MTQETQELSKELVCILMRSGVEIWLEKNKLENLEKALETQQFISVEGRLINKADVSGVFKASDMEDVTRRKNGQFKDKQGNWVEKGTYLIDPPPYYGY